MLFRSISARPARFGRRRAAPTSQKPGAATLASGRWPWRLQDRLHRIRWPSALLGMAWWASWLPVWAQASTGTIPTEAAPVVEAIKQQAPQAVGAVVSNTAAPVRQAAGQAAGQAVGARLLDSYELCKIGRMGQHELAF